MTLRRTFIAMLLSAALLSAATARADAFVDFFRAVNTDNVSAVRDLLARGFDPNAANDKGQPALLLALRDDSPRVAELLLALPQTRVDATNASGETALMIAALKGDVAWMRKLVERGAQVDRSSGWTPLHYAASGPQPEAVAWLLDRGARIDVAAPNGNTPLMMASKHGASESALLLLARGADARLRNGAGLSAADLARQDGRDKLAVQLERAAAS